MTTYAKPLAFLVGALILASAFVLFTQAPFASADATTAPTVTENTFKHYTFFSTSTTQTNFSTTTTATSTNIVAWFNSNGEADNGSFVIAGAKSVTLYLSRAWDSVGNAGSTTFKIQVTPKTSPSETDWFPFVDLQSATSTAVFTSDIVLTGTTTMAVNLDLVNRGFYAMRLVAVEATDGMHSATASASF